ncbi:hypothetical protein Bca4012_021250 [Brassica carinata]
MNRSSVLDTLRLHVAQELTDEMDFGAWVGWAVGRNVRELELDITDTIGLLGLHLYSKISLPRVFYQEKLLQSLSSVTRLSLALFPQRSIGDTVVFHRLVDLELNTSEDDWWDLLTCMINHCPALRIVRLIGLPNSQVSSSSRKWIQPKSAPKYLETLVWKGYKLPGEREKEAVKYLVGNAKCLKRATISIIGLNSDDKIELLNELTSVVKASNSCELLLLLN